jgi:hypothetical protein
MYQEATKSSNVQSNVFVYTALLLKRKPVLQRSIVTHEHIPLRLRGDDKEEAGLPNAITVAVFHSTCSWL